ncbi:hypothetical protein [Bacillus sp. MHSD17]
MTWEIFKEDFLDRFFPIEMREEKLTEFIILCQEGQSIHKYYLEFI